MTRKALGQARQRIAALCAASGHKSSLYPSLRMSECKTLEGGFNEALRSFGGVFVEWWLIKNRDTNEFPPRMAGRLYQDFDGNRSRYLAALTAQIADMTEQPAPPPPPPPPPPAPAPAPAKRSGSTVFDRAQTMIDEAVTGGIIDNPHNQLREALACVLAFGRCFMAGPSGTGKTHAATQIATILGREFQFAPCDGDASKFDLLGMTTASGAWEDKPVGKAWREGHVCLLDELDKAPAHATCSLNAIVNFDNRVALGDTMVDRHDGFALIATGNSSMEGPTGAYATERQSADFVARWEQLGVMVHFDYCPEVERNMLGQWHLEHDLLAKARENLKAEQIDPRRTIQCRTMEGWAMWRSNGLSEGETVGRLCRLWQETEVRKVWQHLPASELNKAINMLGSW